MKMVNQSGRWIKIFTHTNDFKLSKLLAGSFYSDSDSDSENDRPEKRIHVKIKPLNNGQAPMSASVDELRATVENISLSPTGVFTVSFY